MMVWKLLLLRLNMNAMHALQLTAAETFLIGSLTLILAYSMISLWFVFNKQIYIFCTLVLFLETQVLVIWKELTFIYPNSWDKIFNSYVWNLNTSQIKIILFSFLHYFFNWIAKKKKTKAYKYYFLHDPGINKTRSTKISNLISIIF